jgi:FkbM family methyltransferase
MTTLVPEKTRPIIFDVGANIGQSIDEFEKRFKDPCIHAFEPSPKAFATLKQNFGSSGKITMNQLAVGATKGSHVLFENSHTELSSLLEPDTACGGAVINRPRVDVISIDSYCEQNDIEHIHILKVDTQGFDFEVIKGCKNLMSSDRIDLIFLEILFIDMYKGLPDFGDLYIGSRAAWTDALFSRHISEP